MDIRKVNSLNLDPNGPLFNLYKAYTLIQSSDYHSSIQYLFKFISVSSLRDDQSFAYIICGLINHKLADYVTAIKYFTLAIEIEPSLGYLESSENSFALNARSESKYKNFDYKGSIDDKRIAYNLGDSDVSNVDKLFSFRNEMKSHLSILEKDIRSQLKSEILLLSLQISNSKYDLIEDFKSRLDDLRKTTIVQKLIRISNSKYISGDYKSSIRALRRAEKFID